MGRVIKDNRKYSDRAEYLVRATRKRRRRLRLMAIELKGGKCEVCGYNKCYAALEFHHQNSEAKNFGISEDGITRSWKRIREEINKCFLLCANCHRELHDRKLAAPARNGGMKTG